MISCVSIISQIILISKCMEKYVFFPNHIRFYSYINALFSILICQKMFFFPNTAHNGFFVRKNLSLRIAYTQNDPLFKSKTMTTTVAARPGWRPAGWLIIIIFVHDNGFRVFFYHIYNWMPGYRVLAMTIVVPELFSARKIRVYYIYKLSFLFRRPHQQQHANIRVYIYSNYLFRFRFNKLNLCAFRQGRGTTLFIFFSDTCWIVKCEICLACVYLSILVNIL